MEKLNQYKHSIVKRLKEKGGHIELPDGIGYDEIFQTIDINDRTSYIIELSLIMGVDDDDSLIEVKGCSIGDNSYYDTCILKSEDYESALKWVEMLEYAGLLDED